MGDQIKSRSCIALGFLPIKKANVPVSYLPKHIHERKKIASVEEIIKDLKHDSKDKF
jgi:hypothetical protein